MLENTSELEIARDLLMHRIEQRKPTIRTENRAFTIRVQSRPTSFATDADNEDLHMRVNAAEHGRLPSPEGLHLLRKTLPLISDALYGARAPCAQIFGGAHLSISLALGTALPGTKFGIFEAIDTRNEAWGSEAGQADPLNNVISVEEIVLPAAPAASAHERIAICISLSSGADRMAFDQLVRTSPYEITKTAMVTATTTKIDAREAGRLSASIAQHIKQFAADSGRAEVHLAFQGPYPMAVLIGRHLNTLRTVACEWDDEDGKPPVHSAPHSRPRASQRSYHKSAA
ncbi:hypothetical protein SAMN04489740_4316 [Arthrobacter alpinus]|uniref:SMODS-associated and fused to various effectors domain-containing protein n=1 Tax=Arthrobacter alpinus TaxID=656366 RepID=A0A1H5PH01_9MICC|nr:SAVED domain-containing protein [Arthrobacter alpinus]SEF13006.1 hypothetical protein SAMN04489740_4316 [Arthrobacter alpinus]